jgi:ferric enterobactin receptor
MYKLKFLLSASLCVVQLFTSSHSTAQLLGGMGAPAGPLPEGRIFGEVYDSLSNAPLEYANIVIQEALEKIDVDGGLTESNGKFRIKNLKNAKYNVII